MSPDTAVFPGVKKGNAYAAELGAMYNAMPKAVLAAIAVSFATRIMCDDLAMAKDLIVGEWWALHRAGIVPQEPTRADSFTEDAA